MAKKEILSLLRDMAACHDNACPVPSDHPFYWSTEPVGPIVPTYLNPGDVMVIAAYPTSAFANFPDQKIRNVPSYDVFEIREDNRYFDGEGVRDVRGGSVLKVCYLDPLGVDRRRL